MGNRLYQDGIHPGRLSSERVADNFSDLHPPLSAHEARVAAERCYFCHDAPCLHACPTEIDIPLFIRQIAVGDLIGSAKTIFDQNIMGGMCARVCPTETLCEQACVREAAEGKPVQIGILQRHATDHAMDAGRQLYDRAASTGRRVAVVGAGPAGLACAHALARYGHAVSVYDACPKPGGLNEYGIAAYKSPGQFAQREVEYITAIGGIDIAYNMALGRDITLDSLRQDYDAVFLAIGLGGVNVLDIPGADAAGMQDAIEYIAQLRQSDDKSQLPVGRRVVVIGGGMTAIDVAIQSKLLGAEEVTICYRGARTSMKASTYEQELAASKGVLVRCHVQPREVQTDDNGKVCGIVMEYTEDQDGKSVGSGVTTALPADQIFRAIGQRLALDGADIPALENGRITVDATGRTTLDGVWAGGDCTAVGEELTVSAVAAGRDAAVAMHAFLSA